MGASSNVGTLPLEVGDFTTLLLDINPTYTTTGYPIAWTQFTVTVSNVPSPTTGRLAFRYCNNDWQDNPAQAAEITADSLALSNARESGIAAPLAPGLYTALLAGRVGGTGIGVVEIYDLGAPPVP